MLEGVASGTLGGFRGLLWSGDGKTTFLVGVGLVTSWDPPCVLYGIGLMGGRAFLEVKSTGACPSSGWSAS